MVQPVATADYRRTMESTCYASIRRRLPQNDHFSSVCQPGVRLEFSESMNLVNNSPDIFLQPTDEPRFPSFNGCQSVETGTSRLPNIGHRAHWFYRWLPDEAGGGHAAYGVSNSAGDDGGNGETRELKGVEVE